MEAGRELDALIAIKVMGWTRHPVEGTEEAVWLYSNKDFIEKQWEGYTTGYIYGFEAFINSKLSDSSIVMIPHNGDIWKPSSSIAHAQKVIKQLQAEKIGVTLSDYDDGSWNCSLYSWDGDVDVDEDGETMELAICKAAISALEAMRI